MLKNALNNMFNKYNLQDTSWMDSINITSDNNNISVLFPHKYFAIWFFKNKQKEFENILFNFYSNNSIININYKIKNNNLESNIIKNPLNSIKKEINTLNSNLYFKNFLYNKKNNLPISILNSIINNENKYNKIPLFYYGKNGIGKTFLIKNFINHIKEKFPEKRILFKNSYQFFQDNKIILNDINKFLKSYDILIFDDLQDIKDFSEIQNTISRIIDIANNKIIIFLFTGNVNDIQIFNNRLISRIKNGLIIELFNPDIDVRLKYTQKLCKEFNILLSKEQILQISQQYFSFNEINGIIIKLSTLSKLENIQLIPSNIDSLLKINVKKQNNCKKIINKIGQYLHIKPEEIISKKRNPEILIARQISMYLCRKIFGLSYTEIGKAFGRKDHSSIIYAIKKIKKNIDMNIDIKKLIENIENEEQLLKT